MRLPPELEVDDPTPAAKLLEEYFGRPFPGARFTGALFDEWDSTGSREADANTFTADDLVAITLLSVDAGGDAAAALLRNRADEFNSLLDAVGNDRDLGDEPGPIDRTWPAWELETRLRSVRGIGITVASKLIARKRPKLYPIWDSVVTEVLDTRSAHLVPIHNALTTDPNLRKRLREARDRAELPDTISELRVLDVIAWMHGRARAQR